MNTKKALKELQHRLDLINAYHTAAITFGKGRKFKKEISDQVRKEIQAFIDRRIEQIDEGVEADPGITGEDLKFLRILADKLRGRGVAKEPLHQDKGQNPVAPVSDGSEPQAPEEEPDMGQVLAKQRVQRIDFSPKKKKTAVYGGEKVEVLANRGGTAIIRHGKEKLKVPASELR